METTKLDYSSNEVKFKHILRQNEILIQTVKELEQQVIFHRKLNKEMLQNSTGLQDNMLKDVFQQNHKLQQELLRLVRKNQEYHCQILMKDQLICEINKQHDQIIANYQQKITQLRSSILRRQEYVINLEKRYAKQKELIVGMPTYANLSYLGESNELRMYIDRLNIQNGQLKYLNTLKEQQISNLKKKVNGYELTFKKLDMLELQDTNTNTNSSNSIHNKQTERIQIESQIAKYDSNYQELTPKKHGLYSNSNKIRLMIIHLNNQNCSMARQMAKLVSDKTKKQHEYCLLKQAYKKIYDSNQQKTVQIEFLKRKIKNMQRYVTVPRVDYENSVQFDKDHEYLLAQKEFFIDYWKKIGPNTKQNMATNRRILSIKPNQLLYNTKRPNSCPAYFKYLKDPIRATKRNDEDAQSFSFALESCNSDMIAKEGITQRNLQNLKVFDEQISGICRSKNHQYANDYEGDLKEVDLQ